ncbi:hypothetical protein D3C80_886210 [compost metagenome]
MAAEHLTGRTRYRETWRGRLVLQVEVGGLRLRPPLFDISVPYTRWRDARAADYLTKTDRELFTRPPMPFPGQHLPVAGYQPLATPEGWHARPPTER